MELFLYFANELLSVKLNTILEWNNYIGGTVKDKEHFFWRRYAQITLVFMGVPLRMTMGFGHLTPTCTTEKWDNLTLHLRLASRSPVSICIHSVCTCSYKNWGWASIGGVIVKGDRKTNIHHPPTPHKNGS